MTRGPYALAVAVVAAVVLVAVTAMINDPDLWQHLLVGKVIWQTHSIPHTNLWTWPTHGAPYLLPSWLFRVLLWPFWAAGGIDGVYVWRWLTTLGAFALLWRATRRMGVTGVAPLVMLAWCALFYRQRSQLRPDTLVAVLLAAEIWILEARRNGRAVHLAWLALVGWVWANAHISWPLFFVVALAYLADAAWRTRSGRTTGESPRGLMIAMAAALALAFANPFGWEAVWQPFDFALHARHLPVYHSIVELGPLNWSFNVRNGFGVFCGLAVLLAVIRASRVGPDLAWILVPLLMAEAISAQRFIGYFALVAAPFAARDLGAALASVRWPRGLTAPATRAGLAAVTAIAIAYPELTRPTVPIAVAFSTQVYPEYACNWMAKRDVRGRGFNPFSYGGYLLWRFYPDQGRLPFMDIHQTGTPKDVDLYAYSWADSGAWHTLDAERRFDWVLVARRHGSAAHLMDYLDADSRWSLVFADDIAALYLRRDGAQAELAAQQAFDVMPAGDAALEGFAQSVETNSQFREQARQDLQRQISESPWCGQAHSQLANLEAVDGRWQSAIAHLDSAAAIDPALPRLAERREKAEERMLQQRGAPQ
jgi:hypothetical protein